MAAPSHSEHSEKLFVGQFQPSKALQILVIAMTGLGTLGTLAGIYLNPERGWAAYLTAFFFVCSLAVGGMFFVIINHIAKAGWSVTIRRFAEAMTAFVPAMIVGSLILVAGIKHLYSWSDPDVIKNSVMVAAKTPYLNIPFMIIRMMIYGVGTWLFVKAIVGNSLKQDKDGLVEHTTKNVGLSIGYAIFFALAFSFFTVDLLMSLLPTWYSTIFGIYCFAGAFQAALAFLILLLIYVRRAGFVTGYFNIEHIHDTAKYLKGFTIFWAYIAFSQFMLIWYANIPEETEFYLMRSQNGWAAINVLLIFGKFVIPFLALLPRAWKRSESHLIVVCSWVLLMQFADIFWLVYPNFNDNHLTFGLYEVAPVVGFLGVFLLLLGRFLRQNSMVATKDPRIEEALHHHVAY